MEDEAPVDNEQKVDQTWQDDFPASDLTIPYGDEEVEEPAKDEKEENDEAPVDVPQAKPLESTVTLPDPGEFVPDNLSFEYDIDGKKYTITSSDDIDNIPDEDLEKLSASKITKLLRDATKIDSKRERAQEDHEAKKAAYTKQVEEHQQNEQQIASMAAEFDYLVDKGFIPPVPAKLRDADWSDESVNSQDGVKQQKEILDYMVKENTVRAKAGIKTLTSIVDAFNALQFERKGSEDETKDMKAKAARKAAGARIAGGTNNNAVTPVPKGIAVGRTNAFDSRAQWD